MVSILLAAYNGERFLSSQIESLLSQSHTEFVIHASDDCSTDSTWDILTSYGFKYPDKIKLSRRSRNSGGAKYNFIEMMASVRDDYVMLCDQDDVWLPDKIKKTLKKMQELEAQYPKTPILVHTDLQIVDQHLKLIHQSYRRYMNANFERTALNQVLIQNTFAGCAAMYNRALSEMIIEKPSFCVAHDWWLQLVASGFGRIGYVSDSTVLYRQHGRNEIGANDIRSISYKAKMLARGEHIRQAIHSTFRQAESFLQVYGERLSKSQRNIVEQYCMIPKISRLRRWKTIFGIKAYKNGFSRNLAYFMYV